MYFWGGWEGRGEAQFNSYQNPMSLLESVDNGELLSNDFFPCFLCVRRLMCSSRSLGKTV